MRRWEVSPLGNFLPPPKHVLYLYFAIYSFILGFFMGAGFHLALKLSSGGRSPWSLFALICLGWKIYPRIGFLSPRPSHNSPLKPCSLETFWKWGFSRRWECCHIQNVFPHVSPILWAFLTLRNPWHYSYCIRRLLVPPSITVWWWSNSLDSLGLMREIYCSFSTRIKGKIGVNFFHLHDFVNFFWNSCLRISF